IPHPTLGEDLGAAIVLRNNVEGAEDQLRRFVAARLAEFKIPRQLLFVDEIPKGATGKLERLGLAEKLGLVSSRKPNKESVSPRTNVETLMAEIWGETLKLNRIGIHDNFFDLGGDSLLAMRIVSQIYRTFNMNL